MRSERLIGTLALIGATAALSSGCVATARVGGQAEVAAPVVFVDPPTLVSVEAGVWVVRDYEHAVYYVDDSYWVYRSDKWYRSRSYDGGWVIVEVNVVPAVIVHRDHKVYVRYHGAATAETRPAPREHTHPEHPEHPELPSTRTTLGHPSTLLGTTLLRATTRHRVSATNAERSPATRVTVKRTRRKTRRRTSTRKSKCAEPRPGQYLP